jgi:hypothetical protein
MAGSMAPVLVLPESCLDMVDRACGGGEGSAKRRLLSGVRECVGVRGKGRGNGGGR